MHPQECPTLGATLLRCGSCSSENSVSNADEMYNPVGEASQCRVGFSDVSTRNEKLVALRGGQSERIAALWSYGTN